MDIRNLKKLIETDGLGCALDNELIDPDELDDSYLGNMIAEAMELHKAINTYIDDKIEDLNDFTNDDDAEEDDENC